MWCAQFVARFVDQRTGLAMHAGNRVRAQRRDLPEAFEQEIVGHGRDDARHSRHVELERADAELVRQARQLGELSAGEDLRMKHGVDIAALVHGPPQRRHVLEIGAVERGG